MEEMNYRDGSCKKLMREIHELTFAAVELNLFLDNHPKNKQALMDYNKITELLKEKKKAYELEYGPLTNFGYCPSEYPWQWVSEPWPWQSGE